MPNLLILGAGGFGQMVYESAVSTRQFDSIAMLDDASKDSRVIGKLVDYKELRREYPCAVAAFGSNKMRLQWVQKLLEADFVVPTIIHPSAVVSPSATIGAGSFVMQRAVINTNTRLGMACLVNSGAIVDHDTVVREGAHIGLGSVVKANCQVEACRKVEAGEVIFSQRRKIDGVESRMLEDALYAFGLGNQCSYVRPFGEGHINETYGVYMQIAGEHATQEEELCYILQRVNTNVFKKPREVMDNIFGVTEYLRQSIRQAGGDADRETLSYLKTKEGEPYFEDTEGLPWRCYHYITDSVCYQSVERPEQFYESGYSFGRFLMELDGYPADTLYETIPRFHDTEDRLNNFKQALRRDVKNRAASCKKEIEFVLDRQKDCSVLMDQLRKGNLPLRVTHNDTKLNNILFDEKTGKGICVIDLDTIMPGLALNDFGDSIRFGASTASEDERDLSKVHFDLQLFEAYTKGYLKAAGKVLTQTEKDYLTWGAKLITLECGMRFLTDYLQGDTYFKTQYPEHNLVRARTQFKLVQEMEQQFERMQQIVRECDRLAAEELQP